MFNYEDVKQPEVCFTIFNGSLVLQQKPAGNGKRKRREYARGLIVRKSPIDGKGCFAKVFFPRGGCIARYAGERVTLEEGVRRMRRQRKKRVSAIDSNWSIDGSIGGNGTEYVNHSCNPNCIAIVVAGQINIHALRDIIPGEEITVDYFDAIDFNDWECGCGSEFCRKRGSNKTNREFVTAPTLPDSI
ncbi:MAG: SET domain-containing protein-lysine N-methyltransferase [Acidobacteriota bacterium]